LPAAPADATTPAEPAQANGHPRKPSWLIAAGLLASGWILGLVILAVVSANPVTMNARQIQRSQFLVTGSRPDAKSSKLITTREWIHAAELGEITVTNLDQSQMPAGRDFLVPLERLGKGRYQITPTSLPNEAPLIYPATPEAESQLLKILKRTPE
jgi:hypothetical protein